MKKISQGFTIVELLIVIVVIAILAAITVVAYNGVQNRVYDAAVQSDLNNIAKQIALYEIQEGAFPQGSTQLDTLGLKVTKTAYSNGHWNGTGYYNFVYCWATAANPNSFALVAQSKSGNTFMFSGGSVQKASFTLAGSTPSCSSAGQAVEIGIDWFYSNGAWQTYIAG